MKHEVTGGSAFPLIRFEFEAGEAIKAEAGAMVAMSQGIKLSGKMDGGIGKAIGRMFSGESFFMQSIEAEQQGWALLATPVPGGIMELPIEAGKTMVVQKDGFLAGTTGVEVSTKVQSLLRGFLGGEGFFVVKLGGQGTAFMSSYGSIYPLDIPAGETVLVDNGHLVAWEDSMKYEMTKGAKGWISAVTSGEGFACRFTGPGRVYIQTRNPWGFGQWVFPFLPIPRQTR